MVVHDAALACRALWVEVVITAVRDAQVEYRRAPGCRARAGALASLRRWARGRDGGMVLSMAGLTPDDRLVAALLAAAASPQIFGLAVGGGGSLPGRSRGRRRDDVEAAALLADEIGGGMVRR